MSSDTLATTSTRSLECSNDRRPPAAGDRDDQELLDLLGDESCRAILTATGDEALSATELSEALELPLSTTYRKLDRLTEVGLLEEGLRIRRSGKHTHEYARRVDDVHVAIDDADGFVLVLGEARSPVGGIGWDR